MIYHHLRKLSEIEAVINVFLLGKYDEQKFNHFIEDMLIEFSFRSIQYIFDEVPRNEGGVLFTHKDKIMKDHP